MSYSTAPKESIQHALRELVAAREEVSLRMHLLSLEARQRWGELESKLLFFQDQVSDGGERVAEAAIMKARELTRSVREFMDHAGGRMDLNVPARDVMTHKVRTCSIESSLNDAAQIMWEANCGSVPVIDSDARLCGIITDRDLCMATYTRGQPLAAVTVGSVMSQHVFSCLPTDTVEQILKVMKKRQVRRIPIAHEAGEVVGIVSLADIARFAHARGEDPLSSTLVVAALAAISMDPSEQLRGAGSVAA